MLNATIVDRVRVERVLGRDRRGARVRHAKNGWRCWPGSSSRGDRAPRQQDVSRWLTAMPSPATNSRYSSWLMPMTTGTRSNWPRASAVLIDWVSTAPSTSRGSPPRPRRPGRRPGRGAGRPRSGPGSRPLAAKVRPAASAAASGCWVSWYVPLSTMARWNSPRAPGETSWASTDRPPADSPDRHVVRVAAEPRDVALHPAQRGLLVHQAVVAGRAAGPRASAGWARKPSAPSR